MPYSKDTSTVCYIMGLTIVPFALSNVTEAIFLAHEKMHLIAVTTVPIYILRLFAMLAAMYFKYGIEYVAVIFVVSEALILLIQWLCILRFVKPEWKIQHSFIRDTVREVRTLFAIEGVAVISSRLDVVILSIVGSELLLGFYGGVVQLLQPFFIIATSLVITMFPAMSRTADQGRNEQRRIIGNLIEMLMLIALPFLVSILFVGQDVLTLVYGAGFAQATLALQISALSLLLLPFSRALSYLLVARGFEQVNLREVAVTTAIGGGIGIVLISQFQLLGAAAMVVAKEVIAASQYIFATYHRLFALDLGRIFARPLLVSLLMIPLFWGLKQSKFETWMILLIATVAYGIFVGAIGVFVLGIPHRIYAKLLNKG
jgi:O-antigen/teichoic acid export membrane protein